MHDEILDGKPHVLSDRYGYIGHKIYVITTDECSTSKKISEKIDEQLEIYAEYLFENDKETTVRYLMSVLTDQVYHSSIDKNYRLIYRPPHAVSCLSQYGTLCLEFERAKKDNLK